MHDQHDHMLISVEPEQPQPQRDCRGDVEPLTHGMRNRLGKPLGGDRYRLHFDIGGGHHTLHADPVDIRIDRAQRLVTFQHITQCGP